jgi:hypothetical protein
VEERAGFLDVSGDGDEVVVDERGEFGVVVGFGLQPNASLSSGRGAEVEEQRFVLGLGACQCAVHIFRPFEWHGCLRERVDDSRDAQTARNGTPGDEG